MTMFLTRLRCDTMGSTSSHGTARLPRRGDAFNVQDQRALRLREQFLQQMERIEHKLIQDHSSDVRKNRLAIDSPAARRLGALLHGLAAFVRFAPPDQPV